MGGNKMKNNRFKIIIISLLFLLPILIGGKIQANAEENEYLVLFNDSMKQQEISEIHKNKSNEVENYSKIKASKISMTEEDAEALRKDKRVKVVLPNIDINVLADQTVSEDLETELYATSDEVTWSASMIGGSSAWNQGYRGKSIKVAVLDTGIANHSELTVVGRKDFITTNGDAYDVHGHGTAVAGVIASKANNSGIIGIAPEVLLYSVKIMNDNGSGSLSTLVSAVEWCINNGIKVANLSLGIDYSKLSDSDKAFFMDFVKGIGLNALSNNLVLVAAAGNNGNSTGIDNMSLPARGEGFLGVGAIDANKKIATFSSIGPNMDVVAPGVAVKTLGLSNNYVLKSGTSFAAPNVAGLVALYMERFPSLGAQAIIDLITKNTEDLGAVGFDNYYGNGLAKYQATIQSENQVPENKEEEKYIEQTNISDILNVMGLKNDNTYISGININTNSDTLVANIKKVNANAEVIIRDSNNNVKSNRILATNDSITITIDNETKLYNVIIYGDTNGDGSIDIIDLLRVQKLILRTMSATEPYLRAADTNKDGNVDIIDLLRVQKHVLGSTSIQQ
jgi:minor extracellular protease Epr